jgi:Flp pilus assembly protein TadD
MAQRCRLFLLLIVLRRAALTPVDDAVMFHKRGVHSQYHLQDPFSAALNYERAAEILKPTDCLKFDCSGMFNDLGILRKSSGDQNGAEKAFVKAIEYSSDSASAMANLAEIKASKGEIQEASLLYQQASQSSKLTPEILFNYGRFLSGRPPLDSFPSSFSLSDPNSRQEMKQSALI